MATPESSAELRLRLLFSLLFVQSLCFRRAERARENPEVVDRALERLLDIAILSNRGGNTEYPITGVHSRTALPAVYNVPGKQPVHVQLDTLRSHNTVFI